MPNPFAARTRRIPRPTFPEARLRRVGADDDQIAMARRSWDRLSREEQQEASDHLAAMTDAELGEDVADWGDLDYEDALEEIMQWAQQAVADGAYPTDEAALDDLDEWASAQPEALTGVVGACLICAELPAELVATLPEHAPAQHVGDADHGLIFDREATFIDTRPETEAPPFSREWHEAAYGPDGPQVIAEHGEIAPAASGGPGGPGEAATGEDEDDSSEPDPSLDVPRGSIPVVLAWVAEDRKRAALALGVEVAGENRKRLVPELERIINGA